MKDFRENQRKRVTGKTEEDKNRERFEENSKEHKAQKKSVLTWRIRSLN